MEKIKRRIFRRITKRFEELRKVNKSGRSVEMIEVIIF